MRPSPQEVNLLLPAEVVVAPRLPRRRLQQVREVLRLVRAHGRRRGRRRGGREGQGHSRGGVGGGEVAGGSRGQGGDGLRKKKKSNVCLKITGMERKSFKTFEVDVFPDTSTVVAT